MASGRPRFFLRAVPCVRLRCPKDEYPLIELHWGSPLTLVVTPDGDTQTFSTIEQAAYWLRRKWPVADDARDRALNRIDAAQHCMVSPGTARRAFLHAARSAGFVPEDLMTQPARQ